LSCLNDASTLLETNVEPSADMAAAVSEAARRLTTEYDLDSTLQSIVTAAAASLPGISHAGITLAHRDGRFETLAASDPLVRELDELQHQLGEGPCVYAIKAEQVVTVNNMRQDQRWPRFVPRAVALGLQAQMGLVLHADEQKLGGLNLYSTETEVIDPDAQHLAELFAAHAALALGFVRRTEELHTALATRKTIGQAIGILMERYRIDQDKAFAYLTRESSTTNRKLRDIAAELVQQVDTQAVTSK
jgi:GAF domain-containing protein